ncbi:MAG: hypothetical protein K2N27_05440 [Ruminococcus sp.]|nr:hypothetical protein [Ruminococcus sp.]
MKNIITAIMVTALAFSSGLTAQAAENLNRNYIEAEIWEDMWNGKGDNGLDFPEASYKHHLLDKWLDENYGSDDYDWSEIGELRYEYKDYYRHLIEDWDFEDDENGSWTISTENNHYSFFMLNGNWQMSDQNGDTVDTFPPYSTLDEDEAETTCDFKINDDGADSPRVVGKVTGGTQTASESVAAEDNEVAADSSANASEGDSERSKANPLLIIAGVAAVAGIGGAGYYLMKKRK